MYLQLAESPDDLLEDQRSAARRVGRGRCVRDRAGVLDPCSPRVRRAPTGRR